MPSPERRSFELHPPTFSVPLLQAKGKPAMSQLGDSRNQRQRVDARWILAPARNLGWSRSRPPRAMAAAPPAELKTLYDAHWSSPRPPVSAYTIRLRMVA